MTEKKTVNHIMPIEFGPPFTFSEVTLTASYIRVAESVAVTGVANAPMKIYRLTPGRGLLRKVKLRVEVSESSPGRRPPRDKSQ